MNDDIGHDEHGQTWSHGKSQSRGSGGCRACASKSRQEMAEQEEALREFHQRYVTLTNVLRACEKVNFAADKREFDAAMRTFGLLIAIAAQTADIKLMEACDALRRSLPRKPLDQRFIPFIRPIE